MLHGKLKLQAAMDFMVSYGIALIIITASLAVIIVIATSSPQTPNCISSPGFSCGYISINTTGVVVVRLSQALGSQFVINGVACSAAQSSVGDNPSYGNIAVNSLMSYYPKNGKYYSPGNTMYSGTSITLSAKCYTSSGLVAYGRIGTTYQGYLWLNYTVPNYNFQIQKVASFTAPYLSK